MDLKLFEKLQTFTVEEFQNNFDELFDRVEKGESFIIKSEYGNAIIMPYKGHIDIDDNLRCFYDHNDGC